MSLSVNLSYKCDGNDVNVFEVNITHNLNKMAAKSEIYSEIWHPDELGIKIAKELIERLTFGLEKLKSNKDFFKEFDASNGWGTYEDFLYFVEKYLEACKKYPNSKINVNR